MYRGSELEPFSTATRLAALVGSASTAIISETLAGVIATWDYNAEKLFGYTAEEIIGKYNTVLVPAGLLDDIPKIQDIVRLGGNVAKWKTSRVRKDGEIIEVNLTVAPVRDTEGFVIGASITAEPAFPVYAPTKIGRTDQNGILRFLQQLPVPIYRLSREGVIEWVNESAMRMLRRGEGGCVGHDICEFLVDSASIDHVIKRLERGIAIDKYVTIFNSGPGDLRHVELSSAIAVMDRHPVHFLVVRDITEYKNAQERMKQALTASMTGTWELDVQTGHFFVDDYVASLLAREGEPFGQTLQAFLKPVRPEDRQVVALSFAAAKSSGKVFSIEYQIIDANSTWQHVFVSGQAAFCDGEIRRVTGVLQNITERKNAELRERRMSKLEQQQEFMATLSHDLKNPLLGSNRVLELLSRQQLGSLNEQQREVIDAVRNTNSELLELIYNLINVYKYDVGAIGCVTMEEINLASLVMSRVENIKPLAELSGVRVKFETSGQPVFWQADRMAISRVIQNLLDNSLRFSSAGGMIQVRLNEDQQRIMIEIEDDGPGIPEEERSGMFERFQQGTAGRRTTTGSGLGLYLCRQIITAHGGTIGVVDKPSPGATVRIVLPRQLILA